MGKELSSSAQDVVEYKDVVIDCEKPLTNGDSDGNVPDRLRVTKSLVIRKTEILAAQYDSWYYRVILLFSAFICGFGYGLDSNIRYIYTGYATSSYAQHSLLSTVAIINNLLSAASQIFYARLSDVFGRLSLFVVSMVFYVIGTIIQSQAYDVQKYAAGAVFYNIGYVGLFLILVLILSDCSSLKWRLFYQYAPTWPFIIITWISGNIISRANPIENWSWGIGMWAFIFPLTCLPILFCMLHMRFKARKTPEWQDLSSQKSFFQTHGIVQALVQLFWKLDVVGIFIMTISLGCILVPLTLAGGSSSKWQNSEIIGPLILGFVLVPVFIYWESKWAKDPLAPFELLKDRGIWASMCFNFLMDFVYCMAAGYLYPVLIVAVDESTKSATRITSLASFVSTVASPFMGYAVSRSTRLKPYIVSGCGMWFLATGLLYHYRSGLESHSGIIGGLVLLGLGCTLSIYPINVSAQSLTSHENMASVTALNYTVYRIGGAVGVAVSGAIWTQTLYNDLLKRLGDATLAMSAYSAPYSFVLTYGWDTPVRQAVVEAYREVQRLEVLIALIFTAPLLLSSLFLRDPPLTDQVGQENIKDGEYVATGYDDPITDWLTGKFKFLKRKRQD